MKKITFAIFIWFAWQLLMISYARNASLLAENKNSVCPKNTPTFIKGIMGVAFPITSFDFIRADFCWNTK